MRVVGWLVIGYVAAVVLALAVGWAIGEMSGSSTPKQPRP